MDSTIYFASDVSNDVLVVTPLRSVGSISEDDARDEWTDLLNRAEDDEIKNVVLDLTSLDYFGSVMLEWMVSLWKLMRKKNGSIAICCVSEVGREILHTSKFDTLWDIYDTREEAVQAFTN